MKQQREGESLQGGICGRMCELRVRWALGAVWCLGRCQHAVSSQSLALVAKSSVSPGSCDVLWQGTACCHLFRGTQSQAGAVLLQGSERGRAGAERELL